MVSFFYVRKFTSEVSRNNYVSLSHFPVLISIKTRYYIYPSMLQWRIQGGGAPSPLTNQNFLNFMQFLGKSGKCVCWRPPSGLAHHCYRESCIRPCIVMHAHPSVIFLHGDGLSCTEISGLHRQIVN